MASRRIEVEGLGVATVTPSSRRVKGRGLNERELNQIRRDEEENRRAVRDLGRSKVRAACVDDVQTARELGAREVERAREERDAADAEAAQGCQDERERIRSLPKAERVRDREAHRSAIRTACKDKPEAVHTRGRARVEEARGTRRARNVVAAEKCSETREHVWPRVRDYAERSRTFERDEVATRRALLFPTKGPKTAKELLASVRRKQSALGRRKARKGKSVAELVDEQSHGVPPQWQWLWAREGRRFVKEGKRTGVEPSTLFEDFLHDHGVSNPWEQSPAVSDFAADYERIVSRQVSADEREQAIRETMDTLGVSRAQAKQMVDAFNAQQAKLKRAAKTAKPSKSKKAKQSASVDEDDLSDLF